MKGLFASIAGLFERKPHLPGKLGELSEDPVALAEILVLFRMVLADGIVQGVSTDHLRADLRTAFRHQSAGHAGTARTSRFAKGPLL
jgi:uncharacterized tellurite resistance protein B-like protein